MNGVDSTVKECDPCAFYWIAYEKVNTAETAQKYANIITGIFIILFAPAIIIAPFLAKKLNVLTRKIIAMIVLSDTVKVVFNGIMANRRDNYEADIAKYISECTVVTIVQSAASLWSMSWAFLLILTVWLSLQDRFKLHLGRNGMFILFQCIVWPFGLLVTIIPYTRFYEYEVSIIASYITYKGCQPNFTFILKNNGTQCLVNDDGANLMLAFYYITMVLIISTNLVFAAAFFQVFLNWKKKQREIDEQCSRSVGFIVAATNSKNVVISSIQYSVIGFIYIITYFPIVVYKLSIIYNGPPENYTNVLLFFVVYTFIIGNCTSVMNILFYGFFSKIFRTEMIRLFAVLCARFRNCRKGLQQRVAIFSLQRRDSLNSSRISSFTDYYSDSD